MAAQVPAAKICIGSAAPDFVADSTQGRIGFYDYIGNGWAILLAYPDDFTPVATTELVIFSYLQQQLAERNVKLVALSTDNRPSDGDGNNHYVSHKHWIHDVNDISPVPMNFPIVQDKDGSLSRLYNVLEASDVKNISSTKGVTTGLTFKTRTIFIIGPQQKGKHFIKLILNYPAAVGISPEVLRAVDALQTADSTNVRTPANWIPGGDVVVPLGTSDEKAREIFPGFKPVKPYLRFVELPHKEEETKAGNVYFHKGSLVSMDEGVKSNGQPSIHVGAEKHAVDAME